MSVLVSFATADLADMFSYLDELRASGEVNMFGASSYLADEYALPSSDARAVLSAWMTTYDRDKPVTERAAKARTDGAA